MEFIVSLFVGFAFSGLVLHLREANPWSEALVRTEVDQSTKEMVNTFFSFLSFSNIVLYKVTQYHLLVNHTSGLLSMWHCD